MSEYVDVGADHAPLAYRARLPSDDGILPVIMLHGLGGDEKVMWGLESALPSGGLVVAPRAPYPQRQGGYAWNPVIKAWPPLVNEFADSISRLEQLLTHLQREYELDRDRAVLMGFSNGAAMAFAAAMTPLVHQPAGIVAAAGHLPEGDLEPLRAIRIFWGHGTQDTFIPIEVAYTDTERLTDAGVSVTFCEADVGHKLGLECLNGLQDWFRSHYTSQEARAAPSA